MPLVEAIPNISEGRRADVVASCADGIRSSGASLLDVHSDAGHHRSVLTCAGEPAEIAVAMMNLYERAVAAIDLRHHTGVHPRVGAVDVMPLVPLQAITMAECVLMAREIADAVARRFEMPVFLYEQAATVPGRRRLEIIRRGGFEGLAARLRQPEWAPDFGPASPHPTAGATIIGARRPLIAFNVNLATDDVLVAKAIAAVVRERSGGLPGVKALGVLLADRGLAQVTMNVTDYRTTALAAVFDRVSEEAARHGVAVEGSELVGLAPAAALPPGPAYRLKLTSFSESQVLERQLQAAGRLMPGALID